MGNGPKAKTFVFLIKDLVEDIEFSLSGNKNFKQKIYITFAF